MSSGIAAVLGSQPEALITAAGKVSAAAAEVDVQINSGRGHFTALDAKWIGTAAEAAQVNAAEMIGDQEIYRDKLKALGKELNESGSTLRDIRNELSDLVDGVEASFFNISDDGSVTPGRFLEWFSELAPQNELLVKIRQLKLQTAIQTALDKFDAADQAAAAAVRKIDQGLVT